ncbi:MAG TPA: hypothetical protein VIK33_07610 [Anaerolineae bacterium]
MKKTILAIVVLALVFAQTATAFAYNLEAPNYVKTYEKCGSFLGMKFCVRATIDNKGVVRVGLKLPLAPWVETTVKKNDCYTLAGWGLCVENFKSSGKANPPQWKVSFDWYLKAKIPLVGTKKTSTFHVELTFP